jgi:hypothetical protein
MSMPADTPLDIPVLSSERFLQNVPEYESRKDYLGPFLHGGYRVTVAGPIGHGKTSFLMEAGAAAAQGCEFLGFHGAGVSVVYVDLEMGGELIGQAMRDARLPHENFHVLSRPEGMAIDSSIEDRRLLQALAGRYHVVIIDPWHKLVAQELGDSAAVGKIVRFLDGLKAKYPEMCLVIGCHAQEPQTPRAEISLGSISGFKAFQRNAEIIVTFQRIAADTSRLMWVKNRSPRLVAKHHEKWQLEWERGSGFTRTDIRTNPEEVYDLLTDDWQTIGQIEAGWNHNRSQTTKALSRLAVQGRAESQGSDKGGRGQEKLWRRRDPNQETPTLAI